MSKKKSFFKLATKFYKEHEDTINNLVAKSGIVEHLNFANSRQKNQKDDSEKECLKDNVSALEVQNPTEKHSGEYVPLKVEEAEIDILQPTKHPTTLKEYRQEIESDRTFEDGADSLSQCAIGTITHLGGPTAVMDALNTLASAAQESIRYAEDQDVKREEIRAMRDTSIAQINAIKESLQTYLEKSFDERKDLFAKQFECVDAALASGNTEMLAVALSSINSLAASSPFKNLSDYASVQKSLLDPNTEWDI